MTKIEDPEITNGLKGWFSKAHNLWHNVIRPFTEILVYLALVILADMFLVIVKDSDALLQIFQILCTLGITYVIYLRSKLNLKKEFYNFKENYKSYLKKGIITWIVGFVGMLILNFIVVNSLGQIANTEAMNRTSLSLSPIYALLSLMLFAPIIEELLFRFNFKKIFKSDRLFIYFTGLLFGLMHVLLSSTSWIEFFYLIPYSVLGFALAKVYSDSNNIIASMVIHSFHNAMCVLILFLGI